MSRATERNERRLTANDRLKQRARRFQWIAGLLAIAIHVLVFALFPPFRVEGSSLRMRLQTGSWQAPPAAGVPARYTAFDTTMAAPELRNGPEVERRLPRTYPWLMWHHREPSRALVQLRLTPSGRVERVKLLDSDGHAAAPALLELARRMRFELPDLPEDSRGLVAAVEVGVVAP